MKLKQLQYFAHLSQTQHFQRSAEALGISQPALSRAISELEAELGAPLFEHKGRGVILSRYGQMFAQRINPAMREIDAGLTMLREMTEPTRPSLDLAVVFNLAVSFLPQLLERYRDSAAGDCFFRFHQANTPRTLQLVKNGGCELAFCSYLENEPEIDFQPIVWRPMCVLVPPGHALYGRERVALKELGAYPLILSVDQTYFVEDMLRAAGVEPQISCRMGEDTGIAALVYHGFGLAIVPRNDDMPFAHVRQIPLSNPCAYRIFYLATCRSHVLSGAAADFRRFVLAQRMEFPTAPPLKL